jgi:large subunit ribosomal protein L15
MIRLHNMRRRPGSRHRVKRLGCGESSGHGKTSGKGHKGQKARSGGSIRLGFEGGQMPLIRRLPKRGFSNAAFHRTYAVVNLDVLNNFKEGSVVNESSLRDANLIRGKFVGVKILGDGELKHGLQIEADKFSASAREKIEKAGGTVMVREARVSRAPEESDGETPEDKAAPAARKTATRKTVAKRTGTRKKPTAKKAARKK